MVRRGGARVHLLGLTKLFVLSWAGILQVPNVTDGFRARKATYPNTGLGFDDNSRRAALLHRGFNRSDGGFVKNGSRLVSPVQWEQ